MNFEDTADLEREIAKMLHEQVDSRCLTRKWALNIGMDFMDIWFLPTIVFSHVADYKSLSIGWGPFYISVVTHLG